MLDWLNDDQRALRDMAATFARKEVEPVANRIDAEERTPDELVHKAAELGLYGLYTSEEYGGSGADLVSVCLVSEEIAKASPSFAGMLTVQIVLCPRTVEILGTEEQKRRILPRAASGERLMAYSQSEPGGAANIGAHLTKAVPDGNGYRIDGSKLFCTQGSAKTYLVMCKTRDRDGNEGYGCVIVEAEDEGFKVAPYEHKLGWRGTNTGPIAFDNVYLEADDILGDILTGGFSHRAANTANLLAHCAVSVGCAQGLFDKTLDQVKQRRLYGREMSELQPVSFWLAEAHGKIAAARALLYDTVRAFEAGAMDPAMSNVCKTFICETAFDVCVKLLQLWGGSGIMDSTGVNRYMRDARAQCVAEGASEMHYAIIANQLLHGQPTLVPSNIVKKA
ncbi:acyl-CoA dehydrogenase family protein [Novosphingobium sp. G106]|uniref:acyl-CoA dehydrogenase family protein n=1 Tax=Novosphingobium sp. G106 TaxID=2849500 RepID=UPI001C2D57CD|nr:acyl-CoA dehydrogenase family protein [Novosphingobium sp. G106]MBV1687286.1 acyl-CoA dehydrogenase family protein [Novosphingobium sp. G106]